MKFKVGDKVKIKKNGEIGYIYEVETTQIRKFDLDAKFYDLCYSYNVINGTRVYTLLDEEELELLEKSKEPSTLEELEKRIEKLEKEVFKPIIIHDRPKEKSLLSEDERVILRNLDKRWKWIARDLSCSKLYIYEEKPIKDDGYWKNRLEQKWLLFSIFDHLFQFIKWTDNEPYNIKELLEGND